MSTGTLLFRADASPRIGTGHAMRCLALAQAWQEAGGNAVFAMAESTPTTSNRIQAESCDVFTIASAPGTSDDLRQTIALVREHKCAWIAVDGYQFGADYQRELKAAGLKVLFLDDYGHSQHYSADLVLNQNVSATPTPYSNREENTRLVLGPRYALLRREFGVWKDWQRTISSVCRRVLITMGGSDEGNFTATAIESLRLAGIGGIEATVIVGGSNPNHPKLQELAKRGGLEMKILTDVLNIGELMAEADLAVSAAGTTCWELCLLGLPALLIDLADNQTALARDLHRRGCAIHIGNSTVSPETIAGRVKALADNQSQRQFLSKASRKLVDGRGARRVVSLLCGHPTVQLRPARSEDGRLLWEWANDPAVRAASFSSETIPWETHLAWFTKKLHAAQSPSLKSLMFIGENDEGDLVGQIRFDRRPDGDWEVDVSIAKAMRGRGLGNELIESGVRKIVAEGSPARIHALVKARNWASVKAFERAGFRNVGTHQFRGHGAIHLIHERA